MGRVAQASQQVELAYPLSRDRRRFCPGDVGDGVAVEPGEYVGSGNAVVPAGVDKLCQLAWALESHGELAAGVLARTSRSSPVRS